MTLTTIALVGITVAVYYLLKGEAHRHYWNLNEAQCRTAYDQLSRRRDLSLTTQGGLSGEEHRSAQIRIERLEVKLKRLKRRLDSFKTDV